MAAFFSTELPCGTQMVSGRPTRRAAKARDCPWLPRVALTIPLGGLSPPRRCSIHTSPPRTLKAPIGVWFSCLTQTSQPVRSASSGQAICAVGLMAARTRPSAASSSARSNKIASLLRPSAQEVLAQIASSCVHEVIATGCVNLFYTFDPVLEQSHASVSQGMDCCGNLEAAFLQARRKDAAFRGELLRCPAAVLLDCLIQ